MSTERLAWSLHWNYFLSLEEDLVRLSRYIEFVEKNYKTYSIELTRLLFAASSESEVVAKQFHENSKKPGVHMKAHIEAVEKRYPEFREAVVIMPSYGITLTPWISPSLPDWWKSYNKIKHHRHKEYKEANLGNLINSVAGLFLLLLFFYQDKAASGELFPKPKIFQPGNPFEIMHSIGGYPPGDIYRLRRKAEK